jgi:threonine/homoserine/homoserine lactone efflux protein
MITNDKEDKKPLEVFFQSLISGILNPKLAIFFISFFPQFVDYNKNNIPLQMIILGFILMINTLLIFSLFALFSGSIGNLLLKSKKIKYIFSWFAGIIFIGLGIRLALEKQ